MGRIQLFPSLFQNGCSQSSRFPTTGQGERGSGNEIADTSVKTDEDTLLLWLGAALRDIPKNDCEGDEYQTDTTKRMYDLRPNKTETAVHGCHCPVDMTVRMR